MAGMNDALLDLALGSTCAGCGRPGRQLCAHCRSGLPLRGLVTRPAPCPPGLAPAAVAGEYAGVLRGMVLAHKEHRAFALAAPLGDLLALACRRLIDDAAPVLLVPVPSRRSIVVLRGHDPLLRVVRRTAARLRADGTGARVAGLLRSTGRVADQAGLPAAARLANLSGSMAVRSGALRAHARTVGAVRVLVCDDVLTTGATAREAQRALEETGIEVCGVACIVATVRRLPL